MLDCLAEVTNNIPSWICPELFPEIKENYISIFCLEHAWLQWLLNLLNYFKLLDKG